MKGSIVLTLLIAALGVMAASAPAGASGKKTTAVSDAPREYKRSLFGGNESRIAQFGWFGADCKGPAPDIHVVTQPNKGTIRFEEYAGTITAAATGLQKKCSGKPVKAIALYYRANEKSVGQDRVVLDADTKLGHVVRYIFLVDVKPTTGDSEKPDNSQTQPVQERISRAVLKGNETRLAPPNFLEC